MTEQLSSAKLVASLCAEQRRRWQQGDTVSAATFLQQHAALAAAGDIAVELVYNEVLLREERGEAPAVEEYLRQFPHWASQLRRLFEVHGALAGSSLAAETDTDVVGPARPAAAEASLPPVAGPEILGELGRGGMGIIHACRDTPLGRDLAIKFLRPEHRGDPAAERRFLEEAQITGQLQHPGVVPVHQVGRLADGRPYFTMKLVRGQTLATLLQARANPGQERARFLAVLQQICQTLAYAHDRRVVHRDLKPANVMVGAFGEVQVMDWGLAKVLAGAGAGPARLSSPDPSPICTVRTDSPDQLSQAGTVVGTPAYMAPEQARGEVERLDERCDVFGLGAFLCEILTGQPPYRGATVAEVYRQAQAGDLNDAAARLEGCGADVELVQLARRCLAPDAASRPRDAGEVARAVAAHLAGVQERLRQAEVERAAAQARARAERKARRWTVAAAAAALAVVLLGGGGWWWWQQRAAAATRHVELLLQLVAPLRSEGKWPEALAVASQAQALLATGGVPPELRQRVLEQLADAQMVVELEDIRLLHLQYKGGHVDRETPAVRYAQAFRNYGIDVENLEPADAAERIRQRAIRDHLVAVLELWSRLRISPQLKANLIALEEAAADEDWRAVLCAARGTQEKQDLQRVADSVDVTRQSALALLQLSYVLRRGDDNTAAVSLLRRAQQQYPGEFWITYDLLTVLSREKSPPWDEVFRLYAAALALRSQSLNVRLARGELLARSGRVDEAIDAYREIIRLKPDHAPTYSWLGHLLEGKGQLDEAATSFKDALRVDPNWPDAYWHLGDLLLKRGQWDAAATAFTTATRLRPDLADPPNKLGIALERLGRLDEALAAYREAVRRKPDWAVPHFNVGNVLNRKGRSAEAVVAFREAIRLDPNWAEAHNFLGGALDSTGDRDQAAAAFREAIRLKPDYVEAHIGLGQMFLQKGRLEEALAAYREAIRRRPDHGPAYTFLGIALRLNGELAESLAALRRGHELLPKSSPLGPLAAQEVRETERLVELDAKLSAILGGKAQLADAAERIALGNLCSIKKLRGPAARFYEEALAVQPALAEDLKASHRYNAACMAALAGCLPGADDPPLSEAVRARWREQALAWLRADLALWTQVLASGKAEARAAGLHMLTHWQRDPDLAGLRDEAALAKLPAAEREACRQLWAAVQQLLAQES
jgi:serine/threonine-protein kinase